VDIAALSVVQANQQVRQDASLAMMGKSLDLVEQQGEQLAELLQASSPAPHPSLGSTIDMKV